VKSESKSNRNIKKAMENFREMIAEKSTVLLVDDEEIVLDVWNQILQKK
jgi:hypothetical protein